MRGDLEEDFYLTARLEQVLTYFDDGNEHLLAENSSRIKQLLYQMNNNSRITDDARCDKIERTMNEISTRNRDAAIDLAPWARIIS